MIPLENSYNYNQLLLKSSNTFKEKYFLKVDSFISLKRFIIFSQLNSQLLLISEKHCIRPRFKLRYLLLVEVTYFTLVLNLFLGLTKNLNPLNKFIYAPILWY